MTVEDNKRHEAVLRVALNGDRLKSDITSTCDIFRDEGTILTGDVETHERDVEAHCRNMNDTLMSLRKHRKGGILGLRPNFTEEIAILEKLLPAWRQVLNDVQQVTELCQRRAVATAGSLSSGPRAQRLIQLVEKLSQSLQATDDHPLGYERKS